jgi:hypothetical protein
LQNQVFSVAMKQFVSTNADKAIAIARRSAIGTWFALTGQPDAHSIVDSRWNIDVHFNCRFGKSLTPTILTGINNS